MPSNGTAAADFAITLPEPPAEAADTPDDLSTTPLPPVPLLAKISSGSEGAADALPDDDERFFPVRPSAGIRVLVVDGDP